MRLVGILIYTLILTLNSCNSLKIKEKSILCDTDGVTLANYDIKENKYYWLTKDNKKYYFQQYPYSEETKLFISQKEYDSWLENNHSNTNLSFKGNYIVWLLISKKGKIIEGRIVKKTEGCKECDSLAIKTIEKIKEIRPSSYNKEINSTTRIIIPFGKVYK